MRLVVGRRAAGDAARCVGLSLSGPGRYPSSHSTDMDFAQEVREISGRA